MAQEQTLIYTEQGGAKKVVASGGEIEVQSGGTLDIQSGATLNIHGSAFSSAEFGYLDGVTAGTAAASKAVVLDASKGVATITSATITTLTSTTGNVTTVNATNIDAGASGSAGSVDVFPSTASKGKLIISCDNQDGNTNVTVKPAAMAQASTISIPDPGAATANVMLTDQANDGVVITATAAELNVLDGVTAGTVAGSKGVVVSSDKDAGDFRNLDCVNLDAGSSGAAGSVDVFPSTASKGKLIISCDDQDGNTNVTVKPAPMAQASVISIPDPGAATANVMLTDQANDGVVVTASAAELNVLDGITAGTAAASKALVLGVSKEIATITSATITTLTAPTVNATDIDAGASGSAGSVDIFPATASKGKLILACTNQTGNTNVTVNANAMGQATTVNLADPGAAASYVCQTKLATCDMIAGGSHTVTAANASDGTLDIATGLNSVLSYHVMILSSGEVATGDAAISEAAQVITVADGSATYTLTDGDVIKWIAVGS